MKKLIIEILIFIFAGLFFLFIGIIGVIYTFVKHIISVDYSISKQLSPIVHVGTVLTDCFANAGAGELLNDIFKISGNIRYGNWWQTISAVTGMIYLNGKDTKLRRVLDKTLGTNHCTEAIVESDLEYYVNNNKYEKY